VELEVQEGAMIEIAQEALKRKTGARALRAIIEQVMRDVMYEVPSTPDVKRVVLPDGIISSKRQPLLLTEEEIRRAS
jgi:ATP-dependent Clp protease ATP-binding subunit ClpX